MRDERVGRDGIPERASVRASRPSTVGPTQLSEAAAAFVAAMGVDNAAWLRQNLTLVVTASDALRALKDALQDDYDRRMSEC